MAVGELGRPAASTAVVRDDAVLRCRKDSNWVSLVVGRQRPAVADHDRLAGASDLKKMLKPSVVVMVGRWFLRLGTTARAAGRAPPRGGGWVLRFRVGWSVRRSSRRPGRGG